MALPRKVDRGLFLSRVHPLALAEELVFEDATERAESETTQETEFLCTSKSDERVDFSLEAEAIALMRALKGPDEDIGDQTELDLGLYGVPVPDLLPGESQLPLLASACFELIEDQEVEITRSIPNEPQNAVIEPQKPTVSAWVVFAVFFWSVIGGLVAASVSASAWTG